MSGVRAQQAIARQPSGGSEVWKMVGDRFHPQHRDHRHRRHRRLRTLRDGDRPSDLRNHIGVVEKLNRTSIDFHARNGSILLA